MSTRLREAAEVVCRDYRACKFEPDKEARDHLYALEAALGADPEAGGEWPEFDRLVVSHAERFCAFHDAFGRIRAGMVRLDYERAVAAVNRESAVRKLVEAAEAYHCEHAGPSCSELGTKLCRGCLLRAALKAVREGME